jgi:hypothetical protein
MSLKSLCTGISRHNMQPNNLQDGNTKVKFMLRILEKIHAGSLTGPGFGWESN